MPRAHAQTPKRPSIYDDDEEAERIAPIVGTTVPAPDAPAEDVSLTKSEIISGVNVRTNEFLEKNIAVARSWLYKQTEAVRGEVDEAFKKYTNVEHNVTSTISEVRSEKEDILPGGIYVLVSTLSGSILARNRNILFRGLSPVVFGVAAFAYFLPETYNNTGKLIWRFEQKVPEIADAHVNAQKQVDSIKTDVNSAVADSRNSLTSAISSARKFLIDSSGIDKK